jgi:hypothetical protein
LFFFLQCVEVDFMVDTDFLYHNRIGITTQIW